MSSPTHALGFGLICMIGAAGCDPDPSVHARIEFDVDRPNVALSFQAGHCIINWSDGRLNAGSHGMVTDDPEESTVQWDLLPDSENVGPRAYEIFARRSCDDGRLWDRDTNERADFSYIAFRHGRLVPEVIYLPSEDWYPE